MKIIKVAAATVNQTPMDWDGNKKNIEDVLELAIKEEVQLLCLPELCITGYGCEDAFLSDYVLEESILKLCDISKSLQKLYNYNLTFTVGLPIKVRKKIYNCVAVIHYDKIIGIVPKQNLANNGVHYEKRWFSEWKSGEVTTIKINNQDVPFGDILFSRNGIKFGFEICEDAWVSNRPGIELSKKGVDVILNPSASHFSFGKHEVRKRFVIEGSRTFDCAYVYANLVGNESGRVIYDGDTLIASKGELVADGERFTFESYSITTANISVNPSGKELNEVFIRDNFNIKHLNITKPIKQQLMSKFDEFENACCLGLRDYLRKSNSKGIVLSLSGGADSSAVALLVYLMVKKNDKDISKEDLKKEVGRILTCVYQGTENSSSSTLNSAISLSKFIGAKFINWNIDSIIDKYTNIVETYIDKKLTWEQDDIALQNIQARVRGPGVWMLANINNALLLTTSNRSEAAVGYATMDGDTCGGLAPLGGIDKAFLLNWLEDKSKDQEYKEGLLDYSKLKPTAELRPKENEQSDESDLMPYNVLEAIEKMAIRDKMSPLDIFIQLKNDDLFNSTSPTIIKDWVVKFFKLWNANQWKRERYAPSFHFDDESLDPKTWCRWPILNSGMKKELIKLESSYDSY